MEKKIKPVLNPATFTHMSLFKRSANPDNEDGYITVICCRERYLEEMAADGWHPTPKEALALDPAPPPKQEGKSQAKQTEANL